jgi:cardiolipin synthase
MLSLDHSFIWVQLYLLLVSAALLHMLYQRRSPQNIMAWLMALLLLPGLGLLLYAVLGSRKIFYRQPSVLPKFKSAQPFYNQTSQPLPVPLCLQLDILLTTNQLTPASSNNQLTLCPNAQSAFEQFMLALTQAQSHIDVQTYILELDATGQAILDALIVKAQQGVKVRLLMDAIGSFELYRRPKPLQALTQAGGEFAFFQPLIKAFFSSQINLRNHRKIYLFDQTLFTGGMNLTHHYLGKTTNIQGWNDLMLEAHGTMVEHYQHIFNADWQYTTGKPNLKPSIKPNVKHALKPTRPGQSAQTPLNTQTVHVIPSGPDITSDALFESLLLMLYSAQISIKIVSPYFIPDSSVLNALLIACKRGVQVELITPQTSDHLIFDLARSSFMRQLHEAGGKVWLDQSAMLHAKLIIIDQQCALVGSANLDYRSLFINHEVVNVLYHAPLLQELTEWCQTLQAHSQGYQPQQQPYPRLIENIARIVAPIL